jgi:transcription elongation factor GreB
MIKNRRLKATPQKDNLITPNGYEKLYSELRHLADNERPILLDEIAAAAAQGDRSENAEYIYGRKRLREIDKRINFLKSRLERAKIIDPKLQRSEKIDFGATVVVEDEAGHHKTWSIIGEDEADPSNGKISWKSPLGRALLNKIKDEYIEFETPKGLVELKVISYQFT